MDDKTISLWLLGASLVSSLIVFTLGSTLGIFSSIFLLLAIFFAPIALMVYKYGYWLIPYFTRGQKTINTKDMVFEVAPTNDAIVKKEGAEFIATVFLGVKIFRSSTEMEEEERFAFMELWERAVSGLKHVAKYGVLLYFKDLHDYTESVERRKGEAQIKLADERQKKVPDPQRIGLLEREIAMWDNIREKVDIGEKPMAVQTFVQVSATGASKDAAIASARTAANEVRSTLSTAMNVEVAPLTKSEMMRCYDWSLSIPEGARGI